MTLNEYDYESLEYCPWCNYANEDIEYIYIDDKGGKVKKCKNCGIVFAQRRLNERGLAKYWSDYLSRVQLNDTDLTYQRLKMYDLDFEFINSYLLMQKDKKFKILDVGCGNGAFLEVFSKSGQNDCYGVEFGKEAAEEAAKKHTVYYGEFSKLDIKEKFDLIIFRGSLQYISYPKKYLQKACSLLNKEGYIFITAQPNMESFCFKLFKENFTLPVNYADFIGYSEKIFTDYFKGFGITKYAEKYFYEETPYANIEKDILKVSKAIERKNQQKDINFKSPAFWGNMMSLIYKKI